MRLTPLLFPLFLLGCPQQVKEVTYTLGYENVLDKAVRNSEITRGEANNIIGFVQSTGEEDQSLRKYTYGELSAQAKARADGLENRLNRLI